MTRAIAFVLAVLGACSAETASDRSASGVEAPSIEECVQMYASAVHSSCEEANGGSCPTVADVTAFETVHETALRDCLGVRADDLSCAAIIETGCPPSVDDAACLRAKTLATTACGTL